MTDLLLPQVRHSGQKERVDFVDVEDVDFFEVETKTPSGSAALTVATRQVNVKPEKQNHFIEANTEEVTLEHLKTDCIIPSFATMEETISHQEFIAYVLDAAQSYFCNEDLSEPEIRVSHPINGRIPSAIGKKSSELTDDEKTLFYQRMAFCMEFPNVTRKINRNTLALTITGVRAYNEINLYSKKSVERFKLAIGFRNRVCCNLMLTTDGLVNNLEVLSPSEIYKAAVTLFHA